MLSNAILLHFNCIYSFCFQKGAGNVQYTWKVLGQQEMYLTPAHVLLPTMSRKCPGNLCKTFPGHFLKHTLSGNSVFPQCPMHHNIMLTPTWLPLVTFVIIVFLWCGLHMHASVRQAQSSHLKQ